ARHHGGIPPSSATEPRPPFPRFFRAPWDHTRTPPPPACSTPSRFPHTPFPRHGPAAPRRRSVPAVPRPAGLCRPRGAARPPARGQRRRRAQDAVRRRVPRGVPRRGGARVRAREEGLRGLRDVPCGVRGRAGGGGWLGVGGGGGVGGDGGGAEAL
ncbi:hypothetical protein DFJ74DRAFT_763386, partial [Hyaloraphidium curvatum]